MKSENGPIPLANAMLLREILQHRTGIVRYQIVLLTKFAGFPVLSLMSRGSPDVHYFY
jgi:hypothetical protein